MLEKDAEMANRRKEDALKQLEQTRKSLKQVRLKPFSISGYYIG